MNGIKSMLTASERDIKESYEKEGWEIFRVSYPDFIGRKDGKIKLIEAKCNAGLTAKQRDGFSTLQTLGFEVEIGYIGLAPDKKVTKIGFDGDDPVFRKQGIQIKSRKKIKDKKEYDKRNDYTEISFEQGS